jgi:sulfonate transport system permease protein
MRRSSFAWPRPEVRRGLVLPAVLLVAWALVQRFDLANHHILPSPTAVWRAGVKEVSGGHLWIQLRASVARDLAGLALGAGLGLAVGGAMGLSRVCDRLIGPTLHAAKQVALFAWIPLMSVWFGTGELAKVVFIAFSAFYPVVLNTYEGVRGVGAEHLDVTRVFRFTRWQTLRKVVLPAATPSIFSGLEQALIYSWLGTLGAEYLLPGGEGIGHLMVQGRESLAMDLVLLGVAATGVVGFGMSAAAARIRDRLVRWRVRTP